MDDKRVAVVTGAAGGIGSEVCALLSERGWNVVPVDRRRVDHPLWVELDMADSEAVERTLGGLDRVDGLVNNAAVQLYKPLHQTTAPEWDAVAGVNLRGPFLCLRAVRQQLLASKGSVVNISSVHAAATSVSIAAYAATKGGLAAFTRAAALELAPAGVRVNAILPGAVETPALRAGLGRFPDAEQSLVERTPLQRIGRPRDVAEAVDFLLDGDRSGFITGTCLTVDGGALARLGTE